MAYALSLVGKTFRAIANSSTGTINTATTMTFVTEAERGLLGVYSGGTIKMGQVLAQRTDELSFKMLYHCITTSDELKAGQALGRLSHNEQKLCMRLEWQWLTGNREEGQSEWVLEP